MAQRGDVHDATMGPKEIRSTVLTPEQEAVIVAFRKLTLLPLDDCLYALQPSIPSLSRSALHRCLQRHAISRLPDVAGDKPQKKRFKSYPIGYFHIDIAEVQTEEGKLYLFVAIDRTSKYVYAELHDRATRMSARDFLANLIAAVPYVIHTVLTDNGIQFAKREGTEAYWLLPFDRICIAHQIGHRLTQICHPWTNGQVERMNRTIKEATVKRYYYESHEQLKAHLQSFLMAYNFARRLKSLKGLTPYEFVCACWTKESERFTVNPFQHTVGLNN
jgi:transposase InsO family protein